MIGWGLVLVSWAAITNSCKLGGSQQQKFILSRVLRARSPKSRYAQGKFLLARSKGECAPRLSPSFWQLPAILGDLWL